MAIQALPGYLMFPTPWSFPKSTGFSSILIDAASEKAAFIFRVPKTGTISKVGFRTNTVTTGATVDVRLETVNPGTGDPTGTLVGTNTNASQVIAAADDNKWFTVTLTAGASVTAGDIVALVIVNPAASFGNMQIANGLTNGIITTQLFPYTDGFTTVWVKPSGATAVCYLEYADGTSQPIGTCPCSDLVAEAFNTASTPDERGNILRFPVPVRVIGAWIGSNGLQADFDLVLYDADGSTVLRSVAIDQQIQVNNTGIIFALFSSPVTLNANTDYRLAIKPTSATNVTVLVLKFDSTTIMQAVDGGSDNKYTARTDAGAWTETATQKVVAGIFIDGLDDGTGGAAGPFHPLATPQVVIA